MRNSKRLLISLISAFILVGCSSSKIKVDKENVEGNKNSTVVTQETVKTEDNAVNDKKVEDKKVPEQKDKNVIEEKKPTSQKENNTVVEQRKPQNNKVIVIDPGHANKSNLNKEPIAPGSGELKIKDGGGASGISTNTPEYVVNMQVSMKLKELLEQKGYTVIMTKTGASESLGNVERAEVGNKANANLVIRIHADSSDSSSAKGASMLVPTSASYTRPIYEESKRCGKIVLDRLIKEVGMANRGVVERNDMTGFNWSKVPVILVEMGFLSNPQEDKLLSSKDYEQKIAVALANGIADAVK